MRVLHIFSKLDRGGAELRTIALGKELEKFNITFDYLCLSGEKGSLDDQVLSKGSKIFYLPLKDVNSFMKFQKIIKTEKYEAIHSHVMYVSGLIHIISRICKVPVRISHFRSTGTGENISYIKQIRNKFLLKILIMNSTNVICVSESVRNAIFKGYKKLPRKIQVIYNGFSSDSISKINKIKSSNNKIIIHIGRMIPDKNHIKVLEVFNEISKSNNNFILKFIGQIEEKVKEELSQYIISKNLHNKVEFLGVCSNIPDLIRESSLMIFPSKREGLPGSVIETLINGVPVLGSDIEPIKELEKYYENLSCLNNIESAENWSKVALKLIAKTEESVLERGDLILALNNSVFSMDNNIRQMLKIYSK